MKNFLIKVIELSALVVVLLIIGYSLVRVDAVKVEQQTSVCPPPKKGYELRSRIVDYQEMCVYYPIPGYGRVVPGPQAYIVRGDL